MSRRGLWYIKNVEILKNREFQEKTLIFLKIWNFQEPIEGEIRNVEDEEALYESSVRKLGWRFAARLPYWCVGKLHPKGTATFYDLDLSEHVSRWWNDVGVEMCHMENVI